MLATSASMTSFVARTLPPLNVMAGLDPACSEHDHATSGVMAGLDPAIHVFPKTLRLRMAGTTIASMTWMPGSSPGMTALLCGRLERQIFSSAFAFSP